MSDYLNTQEEKDDIGEVANDVIKRLNNLLLKSNENKDKILTLDYNVKPMVEPYQMNLKPKFETNYHQLPNQNCVKKVRVMDMKYSTRPVKLMKIAGPETNSIGCNEINYQKINLKDIKK